MILNKEENAAFSIPPSTIAMDVGFLQQMAAIMSLTILI